MLDVVHRRLADTEYIKAVADENYFHDLQCTVRGLDPTVKLPSSNEAYAWKRTYDIYERLLRKNRVAGPAPAPGVDHHGLLLGTARELVDARSFIKTTIGRSGLGEAYCLDLLGLTPQDLSYVNWPEKFAVDGDPQWNANREAVYALAKRLLPVYRELRPLTEQQLEAYFLAKRVHSLETRLAALEAAKGV